MQHLHLRIPLVRDLREGASRVSIVVNINIHIINTINIHIANIHINIIG